MASSFYCCIDVKKSKRDWNLPLGRLMAKISGLSPPSPDHYAVVDQPILENAFLPQLHTLAEKYGSDLPMAEISRMAMEAFRRAEKRGATTGGMIINSLLNRIHIPDEIHDLARVADICKGIVQIHRIGKAGRPCSFLLSDDYFLDYCKIVKRLRGTSRLDPRIRKNQKRMLAPVEFLSPGARYEELYHFDVRFNFPVELDPQPWISFWEKLRKTDGLWKDLAIREVWPGVEDKKAFSLVFKMYREKQIEKMQIRDKAALIETALCKRSPARLSIEDPALNRQLKEHLHDLEETARFAAEKKLSFVKYYI